MPSTCLALILAAGEGTRMRSSLPKVLHQVAGISMLQHVMRVSRKAGCEAIAVVAGNGSEQVSETVAKEDGTAEVFLQTERLGTAHAVLAARKALETGSDHLLVLFGDTPLLSPATLTRMREKLSDGAAIVVLGFRTETPHGYGRLVEDGGKLVAIREEADASEDEKAITFCNGGIMGFSGSHALQLLDAIGNDNAKGEFYLTDAVEIANSRNLPVVAMEADEREVIGVNTRQGLAEVEALWQDKARLAAMAGGVSMTAPGTVFLHADTQLEPDVLVEPHVVFGPGVKVHSGATIRAFSHLEGAEIGPGAVIGPYARLRPGTRMGANTKVGNFVEIKQAVIADGAKINHLSYIGDAEVGSAANIGAGTITCNYDGMNKHLTRIGENAFIGSNSALVAPVSIGNGAYVGSGSVITMDVEDNALGIARGRQVNKAGFAEMIRARNAEIRKARKDS